MKDEMNTWVEYFEEILNRQILKEPYNQSAKV